MLKHISATDSVIKGKTSLADMVILRAYILYTDKKINSAEVFAAGSPTAMKIVKTMLKDPAVAAMYEELHAKPFFPF